MLKILHVGGEASLEVVSGVNNVILSIAKSQSNLGHQVMLLVEDNLDKTAISIAKETGIKLVHVGAHTWGYEKEALSNLLDNIRPDIVHLHSIFNPKQAYLARKLVKKKIPYIVTPHAMLFPPHLKRNFLKKMIYFLLLEKPKLEQAAAITFMTPREGRLLRDLLPNFPGKFRLITNPVDLGIIEQAWKGNLERKRIVYLGRFDLIGKGIDILVKIARCLPPDIEIHLYTDMRDNKFSTTLRKFRLKSPVNLYFHSPIFGVEKAQVLSEASLYIQTSRSEVFGLSIANAMYLGLPCALADTVNIADLFKEQDLGFVLPFNPQEAADCLTEILQKPDLLCYWSKRSLSYAQEHFQPDKVASQYLTLYYDVLQSQESIIKLSTIT